MEGNIYLINKFHFNLSLILQRCLLNEIDVLFQIEIIIYYDIIYSVIKKY